MPRRRRRCDRRARRGARWPAVLDRSRCAPARDAVSTGTGPTWLRRRRWPSPPRRSIRPAVPLRGRERVSRRWPGTLTRLVRLLTKRDDGNRGRRDQRHNEPRQRPEPGLARALVIRRIAGGDDPARRVEDRPPLALVTVFAARVRPSEDVRARRPRHQRCVVADLRVGCHRPAEGQLVTLAPERQSQANAGRLHRSFGPTRVERSG
jgi:hypothetical protein